MSDNKRGLGRGFGSLIPTEFFDESFDPTHEQDEKISDLRQIKTELIQPDPDQPRKYFDLEALEELTASVKEHGIIQPIIVMPSKNGDGYVIVAGERRFRAAQKANLDRIPALVRTLGAQHKLELSLIENLQRRDLNVIETATAYLKLRDQFNLNLEAIGKRVGGKSVSTISNTLRLLRLPQSVRLALSVGSIKEGQARPLVGADPDVIENILPTIIKENWSARRIEQFIVQLKQAKDQPSAVRAKTATKTPYQIEAQQISQRLKTDINIKTNARGAGQIVVSFKSDDEFIRIQKLLSRR